MRDEVPSARIPHGPFTYVLHATVAAACAVGLLSGCGGGGAADGRAAAKPTSVPAARCHTLPPGHLPHSAGALTQADSGTYCLPIGEQVDVFLSVPLAQARSMRWSPVSITSAKVLTRMNNGILTPPVGVTPAILQGTAPGTATLASRLPDGRSWHATIVVR